MKEIIGWIFFGLGLFYAVAITTNAQDHSQLYLDSIFQATTNGRGSIDKGELYFALDYLRDDLISAYRWDSSTIAFLMSIGVMLILKGRKEKPAPPTKGISSR